MGYDYNECSLANIYYSVSIQLAIHFGTDSEVLSKQLYEPDILGLACKAYNFLIVISFKYCSSLCLLPYFYWHSSNMERKLLK